MADRLWRMPPARREHYLAGARRRLDAGHPSRNAAPAASPPALDASSRRVNYRDGSSVAASTAGEQANIQRPQRPVVRADSEDGLDPFQHLGEAPAGVEGARSQGENAELSLRTK